MIIGLDVGGTHTDEVLIGNAGLTSPVKIPTDPDDLFNSVLAGSKAIAHDIDPEKTNRIVLCPTLTTNASVPKRIPPVGMNVPDGPKMGPELFHTNLHYDTVSGSIDHRSREIQPFDPIAIERLAAIFKIEGIQTVGAADPNLNG